MEINYSFFSGKRILITGDTGFKGSWLAFWLYTLGAEVLGFALPPEREEDHFNLLHLNELITHVNGNILDYKNVVEIFQKFQPEIVFHLAAQALVRFSYDEPKLTFDTNVSGSVNILEAVRKTNSVRSMVYVTSDKCYKNKEWLWGYRENDELGGHDPYSASKAAAEIVFYSYLESFFKTRKSIGVASVRAGNVIGGGDWAPERIVPDCIRSLKAGNPVIIRNPYATRPWQHVLEPLLGYLLTAHKLIENPVIYSGAWNFGPKNTSIKTVKTLTEAVINNFGEGSLELNSLNDNKHEYNLLHLNCDKAFNLMNWYPTWNFEKAVKYTVGWYKSYLNGEEPRNLTLKNIDQFMKETSK